MKKMLMIASATTILLSGFAITEAVAAAESKCKSCHTFDQGGKKKSGPNLFGIMGKKAGTVEGYKYGSYLKGADFTWNEENMRAWLADSKAVAKAAGAKTKMGKQKIKGEKADKLIAFLNGLK